jgi:hypothetical protein
MSATPLKEQLLRARPAELRRRLAEGHPIDPRALEGWSYRGVSLGLPRVVEKLSWKTFQKVFWRNPADGRLLGWNVRLEQDGVDAPSRPKRDRHGEPLTTWFYEVLTPTEAKLPRSWPRGFNQGLVIDYARANNPALDTVRVVKDPLVALEPGNSDLLLGVSAVALPGLCVKTPSWFLLEREAPVKHVPARALAAAPDRAPLLPFERRLAEQLFDAILGVDGSEGLPSFASFHHQAFWQTMAGRTPPYFSPGLRAAVHLLSLLPLGMPGLHRTFPRLSRAQRLACVARLESSPRYLVRQSLATLKILACFAYFEDERVRARLGGATS